MTIPGLVHSLSLSAVLSVSATGVLAAALEAPRLESSTTSLASLPAPYNESADAKADVAQAIARAKAQGKYVLLDFGGNWCPDCRKLGAVLHRKDVKPTVDRTFETVMIDIGRRDKNLDIVARYDVELKGVPLVVILDPNGRFINAGHPTALSNARDMSDQAIIDTIYGWVNDAP